MKEKWVLFKDELPPEGELVLVSMDGQYGLRERDGDSYYDETNDHDDSELEMYGWYRFPHHTSREE